MAEFDELAQLKEANGSSRLKSMDKVIPSPWLSYQAPYQPAQPISSWPIKLVSVMSTTNVQVPKILFFLFLVESTVE